MTTTTSHAAGWTLDASSSFSKKSRRGRRRRPTRGHSRDQCNGNIRNAQIRRTTVVRIFTSSTRLATSCSTRQRSTVHRQPLNGQTSTVLTGLPYKFVNLNCSIAARSAPCGTASPCDKLSYVITSCRVKPEKETVSVTFEACASGNIHTVIRTETLSLDPRHACGHGSGPAHQKTTRCSQVKEVKDLRVTSDWQQATA